MKKYLFVGDTHGDLDFLERASYVAALNDAEIIQVGDWGYVWPRSNQLATVQITLERAGEQLAKPPVTMRFIDGNHDLHPYLQTVAEARPESCRRRPAYLTPNVIYQPRGSRYTDIDGTTFLFLGGAPSIDWAFRTDGISWWPEEEFTDDDVQAALRHDPYEPVHVLVTHDAADFPPGYGPKGDPGFRVRGKRSLDKIFALVEQHQPPLHVHGHWHERYTRSNGRGTLTEGLHCNYAPLDLSTLLWERA